MSSIGITLHYSTNIDVGFGTVESVLPLQMVANKQKLKPKHEWSIIINQLMFNSMICGNRWTTDPGTEPPTIPDVVVWCIERVIGFGIVKLEGFIQPE